jgi:hypothetical protein
MPGAAMGIVVAAPVQMTLILQFLGDHPHERFAKRHIEVDVVPQLRSRRALLLHQGRKERCLIDRAVAPARRPCRPAPAIRQARSPRGSRDWVGLFALGARAVNRDVSHWRVGQSGPPISSSFLVNSPRRIPDARFSKKFATSSMLLVEIATVRATLSMVCTTICVSISRFSQFFTTVVRDLATKS